MLSPFSSTVVVDSSAYFHRWFFGGGYTDVAKMERFARANVHGLVNFAKRVQLPGAASTLDTPNKVILCHEGTNDVRKQLFGAYKANKCRSEVHEKWLAECRNAAATLPADEYVLNLPQHKFEGEADDLIAHIVEAVTARPLLICSHDADLFQLISRSDGVHYFDLYSKGFVVEADVVKRTGVSASGIVAFKTLAGDSGDNIPGVKGIGKKIAATLVNKYGTLERIFNDGIANEKKGLAAKLSAGQADAVLYERLIRIPVCDISSIDLKLLREFVNESVSS